MKSYIPDFDQYSKLMAAVSDVWYETFSDEFGETTTDTAPTQEQVEKFRAAFTHDLVLWAVKTGSTFSLTEDGDDSTPTHQVFTLIYQNKNESPVLISNSTDQSKPSVIVVPKA